MAKAKATTETQKTTGGNSPVVMQPPKAEALPAALITEIESGRTAYVSGEAWFFCEATAKKYFSEYKTITPNDIK